jgi:uncharacterized membrane protein YphA (DoxX/SURF4 family)
MSSAEVSQPVLVSSPAPTGRAALWGGRVLTVLPLLALVPSALMKLTHQPAAVEGFAKAGYPASALTAIGVVEVICTVLFLVPRTATLGGLLLVAYLGGAVDSHVRAGEPFVVPVLVGVMVWAALYLRDPRVRALLPLRAAPR